MLDYKYMPDGKKVVEIVKISDAQTIVQEIFVDEDGKEFAAGDKFAAKASELFDKPVKTWATAEQQRQMKELERMSANFKSTKDKLEKQIEEKQKELSLAYQAISKKVQWLKNVAKQPFEDEIKQVLNTLCDFLTPGGVWCVCKFWRGWCLWQFKDDGFDPYEYTLDERRNYEIERMRLISLYGDSEGNLLFNIDKYGFGCKSDEEVVFFKDREDALAYVQGKYDKMSYYSDFDIERANQFGIQLKQELLQEYYDKKIEGAKKNLENKEKELGYYREKVTEAEKLKEEQLRKEQP